MPIPGLKVGSGRHPRTRRNESNPIYVTKKGRGDLWNRHRAAGPEAHLGDTLMNLMVCYKILHF